MATLLGVLGSGLLRGVMIGAVISLVQLIRRASRPHVAMLGRIPGTRRFSDMERHPDNELIPGALIFRPESSLLYFNMDHVCTTILDRVRQESGPPHLVVLDLSAAPYVDLQSSHALADLADELAKAGSRCRWLKPAREFGTACMARDWTPGSAASTGSHPLPMLWIGYSKAKVRARNPDDCGRKASGGLARCASFLR